jgi:NADPH-dependent glutamate synthase beta subunit-like oxidoreductase/Pyruvate/2-oxoacid:ferredoxin oxidoreductase delta subunit
VPPCDHVCPAGNDVRGFLDALARDEVDGALEILLRTSPFPATCGRVCPAPCMASCNRAALDGAVNVRAMERLAGDRGRATPAPRARRPERVAVVGSGPAGLTAAWHLALLGYGVTVYEAGPEPGGLLRTGIPAFRLPAAVLDREVERIQALGVEMVTGVRVDRLRLRALARNHDAVLVASGLQLPRSLELGEAGGGVVLEGIELLAAVRSGEAVPELHGEDVVVVGGGNTAVDAARSALRLGAASVRIVYRRSRAEMPAIPEEVEEALEEGVSLDLLTRPVALERMAQADGDGGCWHLRCRRTELGPPGPDGRRRPVDVPGSDSALPCHRVVLALGQSADPSLFPEDAHVAEGLELLGIPRRPVYAVGDVATGAGTVAAAIGSGRLAALRVHRSLSGEAPEEEHAARRRPDADRWRDQVIGADALRLDRFEPAPARADPVLDPDRRRGGFREVHGTLDDTAEARRCLSCGVCNRCGLCVACCPEGVLEWDGDALVVDGDYCKGCGICAVECPRHVIFMSHL